MNNKTNSQASSILNRFKKISCVQESSIFSESDVYNTIVSTETPIYNLNLALSGKMYGEGSGLLRGSIVFAGPSKTFKTLCALLCLKAFLDSDETAVGLIYDSEFSITNEYLSSFGLDTKRIFITPVTDLEKLKNDLINQIDSIEKNEKVMILIDSVGNLASIKEIQNSKDEKSEQVDLTRAKSLKGLYRMVVPRLNLKNITMISVQHTYNTLDIYSKPVVGGGTGSVYASNTVILFTRRKNPNKEEEGIEFVMTIDKSRHILEGTKLPLTIPKSSIIKKYSGLFDLAVEYNFITQSGAWYEINCLAEYQGKKIRKKEVENSKEFWDKIFTETNFKETVENAVNVSQDQSSLFDDINEEAQELTNSTNTENNED